MTNALAVTNNNTNAGSYDILPADTTDARLVALWLQSEDKSPNTQRMYARVWRQFSQAVQLPLQSVTLADLQTWQQSLPDSPATVKAKTAAVRSLFSFAVRTGYLRLNPAAMLSTPKLADTKHRRSLRELDVMRLVDAARTNREAALVHVLYSSGARVSELLSLTWQDVQPRNTGAVLHIVYGKGGKSRQAGISAAAYDALLALRDEDADDTAFVFSTRTGTPLDRHAAHRLLKQLAQRAGVSEDVSAHWLRHSHVSHALARGANVEAVRQQVGHSSLNTTTAYAHADTFSADALAL